MRTELYLAKSEAHHYAKMFAEEIAGATVYASWAVASDASTFDYVDRDMNNICWSGELNGYVVLDGNDQFAGIFAYWDEEK